MLVKAEVKISARAMDILGQRTIERNPDTLNLMNVSVAQLGLKDGATTADIYGAAKRDSLSLCPPEVALQLWIAYPDLLPCDEHLLIAMEPIENSDGGQETFCLLHDNLGRWIDA